MLPININGCSFQRNVQLMDRVIFKLVDCKTCRIYLVRPSAVYRFNNIHKTTQLYWPLSSILRRISFLSSIIKKRRLDEEPNKMESICLLSFLSLNLVLNNLSTLTPNKTNLNNCQGLKLPVPIKHSHSLKSFKNAIFKSIKDLYGGLDHLYCDIFYFP